MEKRASTVAIERRFAPLSGVEVRTDDGHFDFRGHAAVFNEDTTIAGLFREQVAPGAFEKTIRDQSKVKDKPGVAFLYNHEPDSVMARTGNGTLKLSEDDVGLFTEARLDAADFDVQRLIPKLESRNVSQMSFAFRVIRDEWEEPEEDSKELPLRTIKEVQLFDVSPVTFPAYEGTDAELVSVRSLLQARPEVKEMVERHQETEDTKDSPAPEAETEEEREENADTEPQASTEPEPADEVTPLDDEVRALRRLLLEQLEASLK